MALWFVAYVLGRARAIHEQMLLLERGVNTFSIEKKNFIQLLSRGGSDHVTGRWREPFRLNMALLRFYDLGGVGGPTSQHLDSMKCNNQPEFTARKKVTCAIPRGAKSSLPKYCSNAHLGGESFMSAKNTTECNRGPKEAPG